GPVKGDGDDVEVAFGDFFFELRGGGVVGGEDLRELGNADTDESGIAHYIKDVGERNAGEVIPEVRAEGPFDVAVGGEAVCSASQGNGESGKESASIHHETSIRA